MFDFGVQGDIANSSRYTQNNTLNSYAAFGQIDWEVAPELVLTGGLWANLLSGFGFFMMMTHFWAERLLTRNMIAPWSIFADPGFVPWARIVLSSLVLFWLPAHTLTFLLPVEWRTLFAAYLGIALGAILTIGKRAQPEPAWKSR